jgi:hypothetical protein
MDKIIHEVSGFRCHTPSSVPSRMVCLLFILREDELEELVGWRKERGQTYWIDCCVSFFQVSFIT